MDDRILKFIIETCHNVPELILNYCQIDSIRSSFELDQTLDYKIKTLDIYGTVNPNNDGYLSKHDFKILAKAISFTNLNKSLETIHIFKEAIDKKDAQRYLDFYKVRAKVKANKRWASA